MELNKELIKKLQSAAKKLKKLGSYSDPMSRYDSAEDLAAFIESQVTCLINNELTKENLEELWTIFAPTSEWDDHIRDIELGESIFRELDFLKGKNRHGF
jgi:hypothetical protein